jgi:raffinose/stachyose/melibiose transport system permease protein
MMAKDYTQIVVNKRTTSVSKKKYHWGNHLVLLFCVLMIIIPILYVFNTALKSDAEFTRDILGIVKEVTFINFIDAFRRANMGTYAFNSIFFTLVVGTITVLLCSMAAYPISRQLIKGAKFFYVLFMSGILLPGALIPTYLLMNNLGLLMTYHGFILLMISSNLSISMFILTGFIKGIPAEIDEAAKIDGCSNFRIVFQMIFPLLKAPMATVFMLVSLNVWNDFFSPFIYLTGYQRTLPTGLYTFRGQHVIQWPILMAGTLLVLVPIMILYVFLQRYMIAGITAGATKG